MKEIGILLKKEREKKKLDLKEVSQATKINMAVLVAIEEGNETALPAKPFVRGFIQTYARYLGLDVDQIMAMFLSDVGTTKPQMMKIEPAPSEDKNPLDFINKKWDVIKKLSIVTGIILLLLFIYFLVETINKYEQETKVAAAQKESANQTAVNPVSSPIETPSPVPPAADIPDLKSNEEKPGDKATEPDVTKPAATETKLEPQKLEPKKPEPAKTSQAVQVSNTVAVSPKQVNSPAPVQPKLTPPPAARSPSPKVAAINPQQIIIEALDNVKIKYVIDSGAPRNIHLEPEKILNLRAQQKISLSFSDGGSVNIIHNGQDIGVPGNLGQPLDLSFPK